MLRRRVIACTRAGGAVGGRKARRGGGGEGAVRSAHRGQARAAGGGRGRRGRRRRGRQRWGQRRGIGRRRTGEGEQRAASRRARRRSEGSGPEHGEGAAVRAAARNAGRCLLARSAGAVGRRAYSSRGPRAPHHHRRRGHVVETRDHCAGLGEPLLQVLVLRRAREGKQGARGQQRWQHRVLGRRASEEEEQRARAQNRSTTRHAR